MYKDHGTTPSPSGTSPLKSDLDCFSVKKTLRHPDSGEVSVADLWKRMCDSLMFWGSKIFSNCCPLDTAHSACCCLGLCFHASNVPYTSAGSLVPGKSLLILLIVAPESFNGMYSKCPNHFENKIFIPTLPRRITIL